MTSNVTNITVTGSATSPSVHVIDFGLATRVNDSFYFEMFDIPSSPEVQKRFVFRSPELRRGELLHPSSDVFCVGVLLRDVCQNTKQQRLNELLMPLVEACTQEQSKNRPSLREVRQDVQDMVSNLTEKEEAQILDEEEEHAFPSLPP